MLYRSRWVFVKVILGLSLTEGFVVLALLGSDHLGAYILEMGFGQTWRFVGIFP